MHETNNKNIIGYIDSKIIIGNNINIKGWCISKKNFKTLKLRVVIENNYILDPKLIPREDVFKFYKIDYNDSIDINCGWEFECPLPCKLEAQYNEEWINVFNFDKFNFKIKENSPSYIVVDNFYENPDLVRKFALSQNFIAHEKYHKGKRTEECFLFDGIKERFEKLIGRKIINWGKYGTNGCFQSCIKGDQLVYHFDIQMYAGVLYLTPDAPVKSGTCLYKSKLTGKMKMNKGEYSTVFRNGHLDPTDFEIVDVVGNVYNRIILFDSQIIHAAMDYFGDCKENGRLFQIFFFDLE
jgi:hypothetical protein